jgi:septal ring factor EnvC (AmiA/AmiB activator)
MILDTMKHFRAEAEKVLKKNEELTPHLASLQDEYRALSEIESELDKKSRSSAEIESEKDQLEKEMQKLEREISLDQEKVYLLEL